MVHVKFQKTLTNPSRRKAKSSERERREKKEKLGKFTVFGRLVVSSGSIVGPSRVCALP